MATGFTVDTPLKVARFGIASVVSLVDDVLLEQVRERLCKEFDKPWQPIAADEEDARARRITAYLDLLHELVQLQVERLRSAVFEAGSEIVRYFEMLPPSPLRELYQRMTQAACANEKKNLQEELRRQIQPGPIDVNIMTKLDREVDRKGQPMPAKSSDALSALRGFMNSRVQGSVVLSAGMNRRLFTYMGEFRDMFLAEGAALKKRITLKVSDYRSALVQGKQLAKLGLPVSEFRVESGLNCGGHAFGMKGQLMGPVLEEFRKQRQNLCTTLQALREKALSAMGLSAEVATPPATRVTAQGGIGTFEEAQLLRDYYQVDSTGWGSSFLFVPEVVNIDAESLERIKAAKEADIELSPSSPLGIPFWSLQTSASEVARRQRIAAGRPGSSCPKGYLVAEFEFTKAPLCAASRGFQKRKLVQIEAKDWSEQEKCQAREKVLAKACICHDLAGVATRKMGLDPTATPSVCCGPNAAYFHKTSTLREMVDHIYGRQSLSLPADRPHMFLKEFKLNLEAMRRDMVSYANEASDRLARTLQACRENLQLGLEHYQSIVEHLASSQRQSFVQGLEALKEELAELLPSPANALSA